LGRLRHYTHPVLAGAAVIKGPLILINDQKGEHGGRTLREKGGGGGDNKIMIILVRRFGQGLRTERYLLKP